MASAGRRECACVHREETPKKGGRRKRGCSDKSAESLAIVTAGAPETPSKTIGRDGDMREFQAVDQQLSERNFLDGGPTRFSQLLAEDSQCPHPDAVSSARRECLCAQQQERRKRGRPRKPKCFDKTDSLAIVKRAVPELPSNITGRHGDITELKDVHERQSQQNSLSEGPPRFSQLLAQDSQCSNPDFALDPDTPLLIYHRPPPVRELLTQNSLFSPPEAPMSSQTARITEAGRTSVGNGQVRAPAEPSSRKDDIRARIAACLLDPTFPDLLTEVEKVWRDVEQVLTGEIQLGRTAAEFPKVASSGGHAASNRSDNYRSPQ